MAHPAQVPPAAGTSAGTAVATQDPLAAQRAARIQEMRERNAHAAAIRGTQWGKDASPEMVRAVAHYCTIHNLDPARHVEVLGGKLYLTGEFYEEKGIPLVLAGTVVVDEPLFVHADARLAPLVAAWARDELVRRTQLRIQFGIPDDATGACVIRARVGETVIVGFNWCGGASKIKKGKNGEFRSDPVGDAEPVKTAQSRAKRRMWRQIVVALPELQAVVGPIEVSARIANGELETLKPEREVAAPAHPTALLAHGDDPYATGSAAGAARVPDPVPEGVPAATPAPTSGAADASRPIHPYIANLLAREAAGETLDENDLEELRLHRLDQEAGR